MDRLQGFVQAETGERISQSRLLARLLRYARRHTEVALRDEPAWTPPTRAEVAKLLEGVQDWGVATDASRIDEELYEDADPHGS